MDAIFANIPNLTWQQIVMWCIGEYGVLGSLSETAQKVLANLITLLLGLTVAARMQADAFLNPLTLMILGLGLFAFIFDTAGGVLFAKLLNLFAKRKVNPMIGAAEISAFPMSARVVHKMGLASLPVMAKGMGGVFIVTLAIILSIALLNFGTAKRTKR